MRPLLLLPILALSLAIAPRADLRAQIVRGTVEDSTGMPLNDVLVTLLLNNTDSVFRSARSGNAGEFSMNVGRGGTYRIRLNRIGFAQTTSGDIELIPEQILTLKFRMAIVATQLAEVVVIERRKITRDELMSSSGFDMRQAKYPMHSLTEEQLRESNQITLGSLFEFRALPGVEVYTDGIGSALRMWWTERAVRKLCFPEVYLDSRLLSADSMSAYIALNILEHLPTAGLHGVEVYTGKQIPPPGLGGEFGMNLAGIMRADSVEGTLRVLPGQIEPCGVVAVWTKAGREIALIKERARTSNSTQVIRGKVVDFMSGIPIPSAQLTLKSESGAELEKPIRTDSAGVFYITTKQFERLKFDARASGYVTLETPAFQLGLEEVLTLEVILSVRHKPVAPLAIKARELERMYPATDILGFGFRKRRGLSGKQIDSLEMARSGGSTFVDLVRGLYGVVVTSGPEATETIAFRKAVIPGPVATQDETCKPMYFLNGELQREPENSIMPLRIAQLYGVEVYPTPPEIPFAYRVGSTGCGAIVVWTKIRPPR